MNLDRIENSWIDDRYKGIPGGVSPFRLRDIGQHGWNILQEDLSLPMVVIKTPQLNHNRAWMKQFLKQTGAQFYPHGKTTMAPQLFAQQLEDGAQGMTLATVQQVAVARHYGVSKILFANQIVGRPAADFLVQQLLQDDSFELLCLVDSVETVRLLADTAKRFQLPRPIELLLEVGIMGGRTGVREIAQAIQVAAQVQEHSPWVRLRGVEGFEGIISGSSELETERLVRHYLKTLCEVADACRQQRLIDAEQFILSAGGSAFLDLVVEARDHFPAEQQPDILLRSGCYLTHDSGVYQTFHQQMLKRYAQSSVPTSGLQSALELWAYVQSRPEPTRAVLNFGKRDCSFDAGLPKLDKWFRPREHDQPQPIDESSYVQSLNDQHALADLPASSPLAPGDMVALSISHPCTTFDKWKLIPLVDEAYDVTSAVRTFF
ncbi:amino acid deaminase [Bremerella sp. JC770]|uniref:amino acid deaminase n=1 Tax=Bremerella sp. JC770 TaxID=3232137 RepID=UPI0034595C1F